eukprot:scaffold1973_cov399-Prasinococcus_capsulatus_cf.AAC.34
MHSETIPGGGGKENQTSPTHGFTGETSWKREYARSTRRKRFGWGTTTIVREGQGTYLIRDGELKQCLSSEAQRYSSFDGRVPRSSKRAKLMVEAASRSSRYPSTLPPYTTMYPVLRERNMNGGENRQQGHLGSSIVDFLGELYSAAEKSNATMR